MYIASETDLIRKRAKILAALIELRKEGRFYGVWCDDWVIRIKLSHFDGFRRLSWDEAELLVLKKPIEKSVMITRGTARGRDLQGSLERKLWA